MDANRRHVEVTLVLSITGDSGGYALVTGKPEVIGRPSDYYLQTRFSIYLTFGCRQSGSYAGSLVL
jgi:hypothetical protein